MPRTIEPMVRILVYDHTDAYVGEILPQQVNGWYRYVYSPSDKFECMAGERAISGAAYFDKYFMNNGVYYTKVIKVQ